MTKQHINDIGGPYMIFNRGQVDVLFEAARHKLVTEGFDANALAYEGAYNRRQPTARTDIAVKAMWDYVHGCIIEPFKDDYAQAESRAAADRVRRLMVARYPQHFSLWA